MDLQATTPEPQSAQAAKSARSANRSTRVLTEIKRFLVVTLYLWCVFQLFAIYRTLILKEHGVDAWEQTLAIINALVFAKVIVTAHMLKLGRRLKRVPIVYTALGFAIMYAAVILLFHTAEEAVRAALNGAPIASALAEVGGGTVAGVSALVIILLLSLLPFFAAREVARVLGGSNMWDLLLTDDKDSYKLIQQ